MADYKLITWVIITLSVNVLFWFGQNGITEVEEGVVFFNFEGSPASTLISNASGDVPVFNRGKDDVKIVTADSVDAGTGNVFTDTFKTINAWVNSVDEKMGFISSMLVQPYGFLSKAGVPPGATAAFAVIWYAIGTLLLVGFIRGSNQ